MEFSGRRFISTVEPNDLPWSQRVHPRAIGLFVLSVGVVLAIQRHEFSSPDLGAILIAAMVLPWALDMADRPHRIVCDQRFAPTVLVVWTLVVLACTWFLSLDYRISNDIAPFIVTILVGEMACIAGWRFGAIVWALGVAMICAFEYVYDYPGLFIWVFAFTIAWMGGAAFRAQIQSACELSEAHSRLAERAAEEERHRLARDIHDLIAHSLAVTMLQLSGARLALKAGDPNDALAALQDAETAGRNAMAEIHRTMGLLTTDSPADDRLPTPCATDIPGLVSTFREAGLTVGFELEGDLAPVPLATGLASYRLVQESLSNAVKHAAGVPVDLRIRVTDREIRIQVVNPVPVGVETEHFSGNGVRGMTERAELLGGTVGVGNGDGTWRVDARLPVGASER